MEQLNHCVKRMEVHSHTHYSNLRLLDCINRPKDLIDRAVKIGLSGIAITDHEALCSHMEVNMYEKEIQKEHPDFKVALGNEIYLCPDRSRGQKYFHFILIAKNLDGHKALRELSSRAWMNSFQDRKMERVVTTYDDLVEMTEKYPNSLIATTACLGGQLSVDILKLTECEAIGDKEGATEAHNDIVNFLLMCKNLFKEDFYIECAPGQSKEQIIANKRMPSIAKAFGLKMVIGTDAHYLTKKDRAVHKAYLTSQNGEREVDSFYSFSYLQDEEEIIENLKPSGLDYELMKKNSEEIYNKIETYSIQHKQTIPKVVVKNYKTEWNVMLASGGYDILAELSLHGNDQERYWVQECLSALEEKDLYNDTYLKRLNIEADIIKTIGEKLDDCLFSYFNTFKHYIDMFWECGSIVGPGRGSATGFLSNYLLGITQLDPVQWELPYWRFLNKERAELPDIDIDLAPSKRPLILKRIKEERGQHFNKDVDELSRENLGVTLVATFGTEKTRSAILTACRGYRSEEYPEGIDLSDAEYMSALIPQERGFLWGLKDVVYGNPEKDRKPVMTFVNEVSRYPGLIDIMLAIEGLIKQRGSHASGVIMFDEDPYQFGCFMKTPSGDIITQYDLHMCEAGGMTKYDFLVTEVSDKIIETLNLLVKHGEIEHESLRSLYNKYLHPQNIDISNKEIWKALGEGSVLDCFQFSTDVGLKAAKDLKPQNPIEMTDANALMRLMASEKGGEAPIDKYARFKNNFPQAWEDEMRQYGVTSEERDIIAHIYEPAYGCPAIQEDLMVLLMEAANFTLAEANDARKIVGKKQMSRIPELREHIFKNVPHEGFANYIWDTGIKPQLGYAFSRNHSLPYSFVGIQTLVSATSFNPIYWNTSCLIVNSGSLEGENNSTKTTKYGKVATAIGEIQSKNIEVSLIDINKSEYTFEPDTETNSIRFGLKAVYQVNDETVEKIVANRPYKSLKDFMLRCNLKITEMIALIKSGAFDCFMEKWANELNVEPRLLAMGYFLSKACGLKKRLTLQNFSGLMERGLIPEQLDFEKRTYIFNSYLKKNKKVGIYYVFDAPCEKFYHSYFDEDDLEIINGYTCIEQKIWDKTYKKVMDKARDWLKENQEEVLAEVNKMIFKEYWKKYASGSISAWEMESVCFYYHEHELADVNTEKYGIINFSSLPSEPAVDYYFKRGGKQIPIYKTYRIIGTVLDKIDAKSSVSVLTTNGVVNVKFTKDYFAMYGRRISDPETKKIAEEGWFKKGTKIMCTGYRRGDTFVTKSYKNTPTHQLYKILDVDEKGNMELIHERYGMGDNK